MKLGRYGVRLEEVPTLELVNLILERAGRVVLLVSETQQVEIRVTPTGRLRIGTITPRGQISYHGPEEGA